ncbi:MAG: long-chain-acyl-CoA synthetase [Candidatus Lambdaproteobacteria bacterium]|nr:long-chain-acyl-CoA synthetase [Candidatus Lambdaproteobacteria bacterium]
MASLDYYRFLLRYIALLVFKRNTLGRTLEAAAARFGDAPFVLFEQERHSFAEFNRRVNRRAHAFHAAGVGKGAVVALMMENRPEYLETVTALGKLGALCAAINTQLRGPALVHSFNLSEAQRAIVGAECLDAVGEVLPQLTSLRPEGVWVDTRWPAAAPAPAGSADLNALLAGAPSANPPDPGIQSRQPLLYIYTSGTTGLPKAARISHYRWYAAGLGMGTYGLGLHPGDILYCPLPLYHSNGILIAFGSALVNGAAFAITRHFSASRFWEEVRAFRATTAVYIGEILRYLMNGPATPRDRDHALTRMLGNGLRPDIWEPFRQRFGVRHIREFYASTEGNAVTLNMNDMAGSLGTCILKTSDNLVLVRYDVAEDAYVRDALGHLQRCAPGEPGELLGEVTALTPFYGYKGREETEKRLVRNAFRQGDVYFRTGDLLRQDERGNYFFVDRIGDTFRWKGENVSTSEVQEILATLPGVAFANVFGVQVPGTEGRVGMVALTLEDGARFEPEAFYRATEEKLAPYMRPAFARILAHAELTATFKLRKLDLQRAGYDPRKVTDALYYRNADRATYTPLDAEAYAGIGAGTIRF